MLKLSVVLLSLSFSTVLAGGSFAQTITIRANNITLAKAMKDIKKQTGVSYFLKGKDLANIRRDLDIKRQTLSGAMNKLVSGLPVDWTTTENGTVVVKFVPQKTLSTEDKGNSSIKGVPDRVITGTVRDSITNESLLGVTIKVKDKNIGTITDAQGNFVIDVPDESGVLEVSFLGYESKTILIGDNSYLNISLSQFTTGLDQLVVVGYGKQKKVSVTGAVSSVSGDELKQSSSANFTATLEGRISGLTATQQGGGQPGVDNATFFLRGAATTNGTSPLILIDGVPRDNLNTLDASEVESVTVLKDASSTAVFGVRGANGVIMITTKRGKAGKTDFNVSFDQSFSEFTTEPERLHSWEYIDLRNEASRNDHLDLPYSEETREKFVNPLAGLDPSDPEYQSEKTIREYIYPDHDYYHDMIARFTPQSRLNVNASGGTEKTKFFVNTSYLHQGGNLKTEPISQLGYDPTVKMDRYSFRGNLDFDISQSFTAFINLGTYIERVNMPSAHIYPNSDPNWMMRDIYFQAQSVLPITPGPLTIGGFGVEPGQLVDPPYLDRSAYEVINRGGYRRTTRTSLNSTVGMQWDLGQLITPGLSVRGMASYDGYSTTTVQANKDERLYFANVNFETNGLSYTVSRPDENRLTIGRGTDSRYQINLQGFINYSRTFNGIHEVTGMVVAQRDFWESNTGEIPFNVVGLAGRATYSYNEKYLGEFDFGYNGSEQFAPSHRFGFFPSASIGWVVSNERFFKDNDILSLLKLRGSVGRVGNDKIGGARFLFQSDITMVGGPLGSLGRGRGVHQGLLGNRGITWETSTKTNIGADLQFFHDLDVTVDVFKEKRSDILISRGTIPIIQGVPLGNIPKVNMGIVDNKGFEVEVHYNKKLGTDWSLSVNGNVGMNKNKVIFLDEAQNDSSYAYRYRSTGFSLGQNWGYEIDYSNGNGYFNSQEELDKYESEITYDFGSPRVGDFIYKDLNGDGKINEKDLAPIKYSGIPGLTFGFGTDVLFKNIQLSVFFQGLGRYSTYFREQGVWESTKSGNYFGYQRNAWTEGRYENGEKITYPALGVAQNTNHITNSFFIMDRNFIRLRNIELSYTLKNEFLSSIGAESVRFYIGGQNLFVFDNFPMTHQDPEKNDPLGYPITKMYNVGLNVHF